MLTKIAKALAFAGIASAATYSGFAQGRNPPAKSPYGNCGAPNGDGPGTTNYYSSGDPCAFTYSVPDALVPQFMNENPQCTLYSRTQLNCSKAATGNYGQIPLDKRDGAGAGGGKNVGSAPFSIPSTRPPMGIPPEQRAAAEQWWQRACVLIDQHDARAAMPLLLQGARIGDKRAQSTLGIRYQDGDGVKADDRAAAYWFGLAAAQGHRAAQYALAGMYEEGDGGLPKDRAKATELYIRSANQGFDKAQMALGIAYELGDCVPRSRPKAIALIRESGEGNEIASVLANPRTPARFANAAALGAYLRSLRNAQIAASWALAMSQLRGGETNQSRNAERWEAQGRASQAESRGDHEAARVIREGIH